MKEAAYATGLSPGAASIADPLFRLGYADFWDGAEPQGDSGWTPEEQHAYERGRMFAAFLQNMDERRLVLTVGSLPNPRVLHLLQRALRAGEVP